MLNSQKNQSKEIYDTKLLPILLKCSTSGKSRLICREARNMFSQTNFLIITLFLLLFFFFWGRGGEGDVDRDKMHEIKGKKIKSMGKCNLG